MRKVAAVVVVLLFTLGCSSDKRATTGGLPEMQETPGQALAEAACQAVIVGMREADMVALLGLPFDRFGPQTELIAVPGASGCPPEVPCQCTQPVTRYVYYRGSKGKSLDVLVDAAGNVCCVGRFDTVLYHSGSQSPGEISFASFPPSSSGSRMEFGPVGCWDCPETLRTVVILAFLGVAGLLLATFLWRSKRRWLRVTARALGVVVCLWYALVTIGIHRVGVAWLPCPTVVVWKADLVFFVAWYSTTVLMFVAAKSAAGWFHRRTPPETPTALTDRPAST